MFHTVTQYSEEGARLGTYEAMNDAVKETGENRSGMLAQIDGKRKYCLWYSHIYHNDITLRNGKVIKVYDRTKEFNLNDFKAFMKPDLNKFLTKFKDSELSVDDFIDENWR